MKRAQLLGVTIAGVCGLAAFFGVMSLINDADQGRPRGGDHDTAQVLVARNEIGLGQIVGPDSFRWQDWPEKAVSPGLHPEEAHGPTRSRTWRTRWRARRCCRASR